MVNDGKSQSARYRQRNKTKIRNMFKHNCTCNCIFHKKDKGAENSPQECFSESNKLEPSTSTSLEGEKGNNSERDSFSNLDSDHSNEDSGSDDSMFDSDVQTAFLDEDGNISGDHEHSSEASEGEDNDDGSDSDFDDSDPPEDPEDPEDFNDEANQENDGNDDDRANFGLNHPRLDIQCRMERNITVREVLIMVLTLAVEHSLTYVSLENILLVLNTIFGRKYFPVSKDTLFKLLGKDRAGIKKNFYCKRCQREIVNLEVLPDRFQCACGFWNVKKTLPFFVSVSLKKQLKYLLETPGFQENLNYREERVKRHPENIEDILDGERYSRLSEPGNILSNRNNFSYGINNDGFRITKTSNAEAQPVYLKLNELAPNVRQKYIILAGIWIDDQPPNMNYLIDKCLIDPANDLSREGLQWRRNEENVVSQFIPVYCTADAKAKALLLNLNEPTGRKSCLFCDIAGVQAGGIKFPMWHDDDDEVEEPVPRTHDSITHDIVEAIQQHRMVNGFRGGSEFINLNHFDLKEGFSTDDLHPIYVGVVKDYFGRLFTPEGTHYIGVPNIAVVNSRWLGIKFPHGISRKPRKIATFKRWRGTEFRNFLLYGLCCIEGAVGENICGNLRRLANAVFLLSQQSISQENLIQAEEDLMVFLYEFQEMFQVGEMKFNVHVLNHLVEVVKSLGNLSAHSTFFFESWNHRLKKYVTSSWGTCDQVVFRLLLSTFVSAARFDLRISESVKLTMETILLGTRLDNALRVGSVYLLGKVEHRRIRQEEQQLLQEQGTPIDNPHIMVYKRAYCNNMECRSVQYTREGRTDSSNIHTMDGAFAHIQSILVVSSRGERITGMVCSTYDNLEQLPILSYMYQVLPNNGHNLSWVPFDRISSMAVKYHLPLGTFIAPVPNTTDID